MSQSEIQFKLPRVPQIPKAWDTSESHHEMVDLAFELGVFAQHLCLALRDFQRHTNRKIPGLEKLCREAFRSVYVFHRAWLLPLSMKLEEKLLYIKNTKYRPLQKGASEEIDWLDEQLGEWIEKGFGPVPDFQNKMTTRPVSEILIEAILLCSGIVNIDMAEKKLPYLRCLGGENQVPEIFALKDYIREHPGTCASLSALITRVSPDKLHIHTGASKARWGTRMSELLINKNETVADFWQHLRYKRFTKEEQEVINCIIILRRHFLKNASDHLRSNPAISRGDANDQATKEMVRSRATLAFACLQKYIPSARHIGQSFKGTDLRIKRPCPMCMAAYNFRLAKHGSDPPEPEQWYDHVFERLRRPHDYCGCCSESMIYVRGIKALAPGLWEELVSVVRDLGDFSRGTVSAPTYRNI